VQGIDFYGTDRPTAASNSSYATHSRKRVRYSMKGEIRAFLRSLSLRAFGDVRPQLIKNCSNVAAPEFGVDALDPRVAFLSRDPDELGDLPDVVAQVQSVENELAAGEGAMRGLRRPVAAVAHGEQLGRIRHAAVPRSALGAR